MKNDLILLAELLANDDNFALEFSSKQSVTEKFELAKSKFNNLNEDEFEKFLAVLQSLEKVNQKLSLEEMEKVSGGVGNNKLKLAALTFLGITLAPMATSATVSAVLPKFYKKNIKLSKIESFRSAKDTKKANMDTEKIRNMDKQKQYYEQIYNGIMAKINNDNTIKESRKFTVKGAEYTFNDLAMKHIKYGDYNEKYAIHKSGGHTKATLDLLNEIIKLKLNENKEINPFWEKFKSSVLNGGETAYEIKKIYDNGVNEFIFFDSEQKTVSRTKTIKTIFPENWFDNDNYGERLVEIAKTCIEYGKDFIGKKGHSNQHIYVANINGVVTTTIVGSDNSIITMYPPSVQKPIQGRKDYYDLSEFKNVVKTDDKTGEAYLVEGGTTSLDLVHLDLVHLEKETQTNPATPTTPVIQANKEIPKDLKKIDNNAKEEHSGENSSNNKRKSADAEKKNEGEGQKTKD